VLTSIVRTEHVDILLPDYLKGLLAADEAAGVEAHLQACPACRAESDSLRQTLAVLDGSPRPEIPRTYFASILPRVHERLQVRKSRGWVNQPVVNKILLPLGAAVVLAIVLWRIPETWRTTGGENSLRSVLTSSSADEIAEVFQESAVSQDVNSLNATILAHALSDDRLVRSRIVAEALNSESTSPFDVVAGVTPQQVLGDLQDAEAEQALHKLESMEIL